MLAFVVVFPLAVLMGAAPISLIEARVTTGLEALLDQIEAEVSQLRELSFLEEVDCQFITRDELREWLLEDLEEDIEEINVTQELFVFLDLMEEGQDLYNILLGLYSEQIIGFYDYVLDELYVVSDMGELGPLEEVTFAHEYTHALQDQHFDLQSLPSPEDNSDLSMAGDSLVEGDASLLEGIYYWVCLDNAEREVYAQQVAELDREAFDAAPRVIQENLIFPYESGVAFVIALFDQDRWDAVNQAYSDPPQSTEQILHPEKYYLERDKPQAITMPDLESALGTGWSLLDSDVLGELNMRIYLETFLGIDSEEAINAAEGWDGDRYVFLKDAEGRKLLVLSSVWDSQTEAEEFFQAYITFVENKSGGAWTLYLDDVGKKWWQTEELSLYLRQQGSEVLIIIAPDEATTRQVLTATYSPAALDVNISSPAETETYSTCQHFQLTFTICNSGEADALDVTATIDPGATAEVESRGQGVPWTTLVLGNIPGGQTIGPFTYDMHCTSSGDSTITVMPAGIDENTDVAIADITPDSVVVKQGTAAALEVEISYPVATETYSICQHFDLIFTISNSAEADALNVTATIDPGTAAEVGGQGEGVSWTTPVLGDILGGQTIGPFTYDMHCTASGESTITVTPKGIDENTGEDITNITADSVTVKQETAAALEVEISSPTGTETYSTCQHFDLTFTINNSGEADALDVTATIDPGATAEVESRGQGVSWTTLVLGDIPGGQTIGPFTYDMHCTSSGESTITVMPAGIDGNTSEDITAIKADSITVNKEEAAALRVEISYPVVTETYSTSQHFYLIFTIKNSGEADALNVTATIDPGTAAEVGGQGQGVSWTTLVLGDIPGGRTIGPFTYDMHCTVSGDSTITVMPAGIDENTSVAIADITADSVTVKQETAAALKVDINSPAETETCSACQHLKLTFTIKNNGEADALDVTAIIDPGATAEVEGRGQGVSWTTPVLGDILGGRRVGPFTYDMHCIASGDSTITVTPAGTDKNTGVAITDITADSVTIEQGQRLPPSAIAGIAVGACAAAVGIFLALRKWGWKR